MPDPGTQLLQVAAVLIDGMDIVVVKTPDIGVGAKDARILIARAWRRGCVLLAFGPFPHADLTLTVTARRWHGLERGHGRLGHEDVTVVVRGRGVAQRPRTAQIRLPSAVDQTAGETAIPANARCLRAV